MGLLLHTRNPHILVLCAMPSTPPDENQMNSFDRRNLPSVPVLKFFFFIEIEVGGTHSVLTCSTESSGEKLMFERNKGLELFGSQRPTETTAGR